MNRKRLLGVSFLLAAILMGGSIVLAAEKSNANPQQKSSGMNKSVKELQEDFRKLAFGMFIHYNMATYKGVQWVEGYHSPADFDPGGMIDTDAWADAAVSASTQQEFQLLAQCRP